MEDIEYLTAEHTLEVYAAIFRCSLQEANDQLRDRNALESAVVRPRSYAYYQGADLALQAAVLAHGIAETQPFVEATNHAAVACERPYGPDVGLQRFFLRIVANRAKWRSVPSGNSLFSLMPATVGFESTSADRPLQRIYVVKRPVKHLGLAS
jgi:hypothetical protein